MAQNNSKIIDEQQVYYVEPNYNMKMAEKFGDDAVDYMFDSEDYCVSIDLEIEVFARQHNDKVTSGNNVYIFSYTTKDGGNSTASFMGGKKMKYGKNNKTFNILTTDYVNTFYTDIVNDNTNKMSSNAECFGIESINISYQTYAVPVVDITFTDIKGVSLFAPEELRHGKSNSNGVGGFPDEDISGSFFKCFFTFPYPKFTLKVKGFYGKPVSYDLTCSKFNAKFDSKTGNFGATATLVGYAFSLFNDISLDAVLAAPLSDFYGKEYWNNHILGKTAIHDDDGKIITTDEQLQTQKSNSPLEYTVKDRYGNNVPPQTFQEIVKNIQQINDKISATTAIKEVFERQTNGNEAKTELENIKTDYWNASRTIVNDLIQSIGIDYVFYNDTFSEVVVLLDSQTDIKEKVKHNFDDLNKKIQNLRQDENKGKYFGQIGEIQFLNYLTKEILIESKMPTDNVEIDVDKKFVLSVNNCDELSDDIKHKINAKVQTDVNLYRHYKTGIYFNNKQFFVGVDTSLQNVDNEVKETTEEIDKQTNEVIAEVLGFTPTVENFTKIILCHLETLLYIIHQTTNDANASNRSVNDFKLKDNKISGLDVTNVMPAWPKVTEEDKNREQHDAWIGNFPSNGKAQPEANAVEGLLKAVQNFSKTIEETNEVLSKQTSENQTNSCDGKLGLPLVLSDVLIGGNPFGTEKMLITTDSQVDEIVAKLFMRMCNVATIISDDKKYDYGKFDAINFYNIYGKQLTKFTKDAIQTSDESKFLDIMTNKNGDGSLWTENQKMMSNANNENYLNSHISKFPLHDINLMDSGEINNYTLSILNYGTQIINENYKNNIFFINKEEFNKYSNIITNNVNCTTDDTTKYNNYLTNGLLKDLKYSNDKIYNKEECFTYDYDGWSSEYIDDGITLSYYLKDINNEHTQNSNFEFIEYSKRNNFELNNKTYHRDKFDFDTFCQNSKLGTDNIVEDVIFPSLRCHDDNDYSLVLNEKFYSKNVNMHAIMFLECFRHHDVKHFIKILNNKRNEIIFTTKICALLLGGYLCLKDLYDTNFNGKNGYDRLDKSDDIDEFGTFWKNADIQLKYRFKNYFSEWCKNEFATIYNLLKLEINPNSSLNEFKKALMKHEVNASNLKKYLKESSIDNFLKLYTRYDENGNLYFNENNDLVKQLTKLYCEPLLIIKPNYFTSYTSVPDKLKKATTQCNSYIKGFVDKLKEIISGQTQQNQTSENFTVNQITPQRIPEEIKIALYNYLKIAHDKWMYTDAFEKWKTPHLFKNFHFIDAYYNKIGNLAIINPLKMAEQIVASQQQQNYSLLSFMSSIMQQNNINIQCVQNFIDLETNGDYLDRMRDMFTPFSYIEQGDCNDQPHFICIYIGQTSSHLDIDGSQYTNDSFDLSDTKNWPVAISSKTPQSGYKIPAFGVSFGSQYQSFFTDINVSSDSPTVTEQSLQATFMIASMNNTTGGENTKKTYCLGQDLFTVYANNSYTCEVTMMGCAWIQPLMYFVLNNVPMFRGSYLIQKVTHNIVPGNMTTKFTGVRMANTLSPFIKNVFYSSIDNEKEVSETVMSESEEEPQNGCHYDRFSVGKNSGGITPSILTEEGGYEKYGCSDGKPKRYNTILDALSCTINQEVGSSDKLQCQLATTVLYNLWKKNGENFKKVFKHNVTAFEHENNGGDKKQFIRDIITEIFTQTPMVVVGATTRVNSGITIYENNQLTGEYTKPVTITKEMVQKMYMYCSTYGYDVSNTWPEQKYNSKGKPYLEAHPEYWRSKQYLCHHQYANSNNGHVYVGDKIIWEYTPKQSEDGVSQNAISNLGNNFINSLQKSINSSNKITCKISGEKPLPNDPDSFYIVSDKESDLGVVFEIIITTYYDYVSTLNWICNDENSISSNKYPSKIFVKVTEGNAITHSINVGYVKDNGFTLITQTSDNVNDGYYFALNQAYDVTTQNGLNSVKCDCKQFRGLDDDKIIELITKESKQCPITQTQPTVTPNQVQKPNTEQQTKPTKPSTNPTTKPSTQVNKPRNTSNSCDPTKLPSTGVVDKSNLVTNKKMKLVLSDVGHLNSKSLGCNYTLGNDTYSGKCTSGPSTWYQRSGMEINADKWWCGNLKNGKKCNFQNTKSYLMSLGFVPVWHGTLQELDTLNGKTETSVGSNKIILYPGDIGTMYTGVDGHAHGIMWDGSKWRSDCVQWHANCYSKLKGITTGNYGGVIWRHPDYQDSNHPMLPAIT